MNRTLPVLSIVIPAVLLLLAALFPTLDHTVEVPLLHFYVVTFFTFAAAVVAFFTAVALGQRSMPRHQLLATAFAVMGTLLFIHGAATPNALIMGFNPGIRWSAWLTMFLGGVILALASLDKPRRPLTIDRLGLIHWSLALFCSLFILVVIFTPHWLTRVEEMASPGIQQLIYGVTLLTWLFAAFSLWST